MELRMSAKVISTNGNSIEIKLNIEFTGSMLDSEEIIQQELNKAGRLASEQLLGNFDTDGEKIVKGNITFHSKGSKKNNSEHPTEK